MVTVPLLASQSPQGGHVISHNYPGPSSHVIPLYGQTDNLRCSRPKLDTLLLLLACVVPANKNDTDNWQMLSQLTLGLQLSSGHMWNFVHCIWCTWEITSVQIGIVNWVQIGYKVKVKLMYLDRYQVAFREWHKRSSHHFRDHIFCTTDDQGKFQSFQDTSWMCSNTTLQQSCTVSTPSKFT